MKELTRSTLIAIVASSLSLLAFYAVGVDAQSAWTAAPANPPSGNVAGPLTTGSTGQEKTGNLILNTAGTLANGLIVANGNVGVGTLNPNYLLDINGTFAAKFNLDLKSGTSQIAWNRDSRTGSVYDSVHHAWQLGPLSATNDGFMIKHYGPSGTYSGGVLFSIDDNVGIGTQTPNASKGTGGYVDVKDVYLRDAGKWASAVGGAASGSVVAGCFPPEGFTPLYTPFPTCWGGAAASYTSAGSTCLMSPQTCPVGSTRFGKMTTSDECGATGFFLCVKN